MMENNISTQDNKINEINKINDKNQINKNEINKSNEIHKVSCEILENNTYICGLRKNIKTDYMFRFMSNFNLTGAIWVLYLSYKGMSLGQIGLLEGIFHIVSFLFEVPTGAMADLTGRKNTILLGRLSAVISGLLMVTSNHFLGYAIAFAFSAFSYNLNSGSEEALVYDSLKILKREKEFLKINGRLNFIQEAASGFASFLGGILAEISYFYAYTAGMIISAAALFNGSFFYEPKALVDRGNSEKSTVRKHFKACITIFKHNKPVRSVLVFYPVVTAFATATYFYGQQHLFNIGLNKIQISFVILLSGIFASFGALSAEKFSRIFGDKEKYVGASGLAIFIAAFGINHTYISVVAFLVQSYFGSLLYPISSNALNQLIPSAQRATIISVSSVMFSAAMIVIFPICGYVGDYIGLGKVFYILGIWILIFQVWFIGKGKANH
ncbi:MFS transporter [Anaerocolumna sp. MB42-C2]|uniref:MFS transporter n=1 Tax=Anaerocolumna sp. MB42-C2 TaxID=3070997 RepID=UPI0027DEC628|nr:MFS transporter [Anaerocolumna sp. MB42-C2]WMJ86666.1 MFS transporter [Anaerocolumna sp. MB42-C2]